MAPPVVSKQKPRQDAEPTDPTPDEDSPPDPRVGSTRGPAHPPAHPPATEAAASTSTTSQNHEVASAAAHGCCAAMAFMFIFQVVGAGLRAVFGPFFGNILAAGVAGGAMSGGSTAIAQHRGARRG